MGTVIDVVTPSSQNGSVDSFCEELEKLEAERDEIIADIKRPISKVFRHLEIQKQRRLKIATDFRDIELQNLYNQYRADIQQASDEFTRGKRQLQSAMLGMSTERRQRIDSVIRHSSALASVSGLPRRRKRGKNGNTQHDRFGRIRLCAEKESGFITALENQGLVRIALTPDEVNTDLQLILRHLEDARANSHLVSSSLDRRTAENDVGNVDKIHSSKGTLHYHDITCEKGDRVSIFAASRPKPSVKYSGIVLSVNPKEITIRADDSTSYSSLQFVPPTLHPFFLFSSTSLFIRKPNFLFTFQSI